MILKTVKIVGILFLLLLAAVLEKIGWFENSKKTSKKTNRSNSFKLPQYKPSKEARRVLVKGRIISQNEQPQDMLERVITTLFSVEEKFETRPQTVKQLAEEFAEYMVNQDVTPGTPTLTNAGRYDSALSSCVVIPVDLRDKANAAQRIKSYYLQNMGSGFDFTQYDNPVDLLEWINQLSAKETATGKYDRYIGNMGTLHVSHPKVMEFIHAKRSNAEKIHFNISIDATEKFMDAAVQGKYFLLADRTRIDAADLLLKIAECAWYNGDPGLIFLERMNKDNPIFELSRHVSTPPCSEMGLAEGETCQFGYINLANFVQENKNGAVKINYDKLERVTRLLTRVLDNAIEYSISRYPTQQSADITKIKRKIGIGVCGLADTLIKCSLPYDSAEARSLARDIVSFINYTSKCESVKLASDRGFCLAMIYPNQNRYITGQFLEEKYGNKPTATVSANDWRELATTICNTWNLRNISTTALPPTGRASKLLGVTSSIEPLFSIYDNNGKIKKNLINFLSRKLNGNRRLIKYALQKANNTGSFQEIEVLPNGVRKCLQTAKEISPMGHLKMVADLAGINGVVDEAASKTLNLPKYATVQSVRETLVLAYRLGLKNISVYRDGTKTNQPEIL